MKKYQTVQVLRDLEQFGIKPLTGEACAYSMRILCDVSEKGVALLADFFGIPELALAKNWNSRVGNDMAVGSIMLSPDMTKKLAQFAFFKEGALAIVEGKDNSVTGVFEQALLDAYEELIASSPNGSHYSLLRNYAQGCCAPRVGSRNGHMATGRVQ